MHNRNVGALETNNDIKEERHELTSHERHKIHLACDTSNVGHSSEIVISNENRNRHTKGRKASRKSENAASGREVSGLADLQMRGSRIIHNASTVGSHE